ncbi:hypothetical protein OG884_26480 [Streptosporangium sp. NBC_01755]|uniref:hypothetical protein n=1 Tax=Streptosporangium sp. NBC_01755 TaxID=2975949 RepID=UPI002DDA7F12|nr:hypothetical protein [Streptosporangium sp. NBC_01755]WSC98396.1 hypothetical protein OG884_26480 [Streptosporangium sp. NBC_01755]
MADRIQPYTPADLLRLQSVQTRPRGWSNRIKPKVTGGRDAQRRPVKVTLDELGNLIRERWTGQDVHIFLPHLRVRHSITEERR